MNSRPPFLAQSPRHHKQPQPPCFQGLHRPSTKASSVSAPKNGVSQRTLQLVTNAAQTCPGNELRSQALGTRIERFVAGAARLDRADIERLLAARLTTTRHSNLLPTAPVGDTRDPDSRCGSRGHKPKSRSWSPSSPANSKTASYIDSIAFGNPQLSWHGNDSPLSETTDWTTTPYELSPIPTRKPSSTTRLRKSSALAASLKTGSSPTTEPTVRSSHGHCDTSRQPIEALRVFVAVASIGTCCPGGQPSTVRMNMLGAKRLDLRPPAPHSI